MNSTDLECETPLQTSCRNAKLKNETSSETKPIIIGASLGALFICVLICALIVFCKRRKSKLAKIKNEFNRKYYGPCSRNH